MDLDWGDSDEDLASIGSKMDEQGSTTVQKAKTVVLNVANKEEKVVYAEDLFAEKQNLAREMCKQYGLTPSVKNVPDTDSDLDSDLEEAQPLSKRTKMNVVTVKRQRVSSDEGIRTSTVETLPALNKVAFGKTSTGDVSPTKKNKKVGFSMISTSDAKLKENFAEIKTAQAYGGGDKGKPFFINPKFIGVSCEHYLGPKLKWLKSQQDKLDSKTLQIAAALEEKNKKKQARQPWNSTADRMQDETRKKNDIAWEKFKERRRARGNEPQRLETQCLRVIRQHLPLFENWEEEVIVDDCTLASWKTIMEKNSVFIPASINRYLAPYQREGVQFLYDIYSGVISPDDVMRGGLLVDEMGLGKTIQVIAFVAAILEKTGFKRIDKNMRNKMDSGLILFVVPSSVVGNWKLELDTWGYFKCEQIDRCDYGELVRECTKSDMEILICSYDRLKAAVSVSDEFRNYNWRLVVFDEAHRLKSIQTQNYKCAKQLKSKCKIGLTGTPFSNKLPELWALCNVVSPDTFGPLHTFARFVVRPIVQGRKHNASPAATQKMHQVLDSLKLTLKRIMLRRGKRYIEHKLHGKQDIMVLCKLTETQERCYLAALKSPDFIEILQNTVKRTPTRLVDPHDVGLQIPVNDMSIYGSGSLGDCIMWKLNHRKFPDAVGPGPGSDTEYGDVIESDEDKTEPSTRVLSVHTLAKHESSEDETDEEIDSSCPPRIKREYQECLTCRRCTSLPALCILAKIANHLDLVRVKNVSVGELSLKEKRKMRKSRRLAKYFLKPLQGTHNDNGTEYFVRSSRLSDMIDEEQSGKMKVLLSLLRKWDAEQETKALVFTNSLHILDILEHFLDANCITFLRLDGSTKPSERHKMCSEFNNTNRYFVFLISTKAGGEGINLQSASKVVIFDPDWNPSNDLQAQDRAYRIGQKKAVEVYRLISQGTIEEIKYLRQVSKKQLSATVIDESTEKRMFNEGDNKGMHELLRYTRGSFTHMTVRRYEDRIKKFAKSNALLASSTIQQLDTGGENAYSMYSVVGREQEEPSSEEGTPTIEEAVIDELNEDVTDDVEQTIASRGIHFSSMVGHDENEESIQIRQVQQLRN